jgi:hypothetical protein
MDASRLPVECPICHRDVTDREGELVDHFVAAHSKQELAERLRAMLE